MTPIRTLLVDDEPIARQILREELQAMDDVKLVGEAVDGIQALQAIQDQRPDLVFLDLQMPQMDGFEVVRNLTGRSAPQIVFVTAFDQHAVEAFEAGAVDYLLKPVSTQRLERCMARVRQLHADSVARAGNTEVQRNIARASPAQRPSKIVAKLGEELHLLDTGQVLACVAEREIVWIITAKQRYMATLSLKRLEEKLTDLNFSRVHRNALVNMDHVVKMSPLSSQRWMLTLSNQQQFTVSKRKAKEVQQLLSW